MKALQDTLNQRHTTVSEILELIDMSKIMATMTKLRSALSEISTRNAQVVMRNHMLQFQLSYMPPKMWNSILRARKKDSKYYNDQRTNSHYLVPEKDTEFLFEQADPSDLRESKLQRMAAVSSVNDLLHEVDEVMDYIKTHTGVTDNFDYEDREIAEEAISNTDVAPSRTYGVPCPVKHVPQRVDKVIKDIASDDNVTKRSHNAIVHTGHKVHPSKSQRITPTDDLNQSSSAAPVQSTFGDMPAQSAFVYKTSAYYTTPEGEQSRTMVGEHPFSPIGRSLLSDRMLEIGFFGTRHRWTILD